jgi:NDP-sugar pyrophosphorylase family protein
VLPKALVPVCGVPLLDYAVGHCLAFGLDRVVVNAHHQAEAVRAWARGLAAGVSVTVSVEAPEILGTGGGLKAVSDVLAERVVVLNGDVLCDVDLSVVMGAVPAGGAAMVLRPDRRAAEERYGIVVTDGESRVVDLKKMACTTPVGPTRWDSHFTGIHALDRIVLDRVPEGFGCIVRTAYLELVAERLLVGVEHGGVWLDVGDPASYLSANLSVLRGEVKLHFDPMARASWWTRTGGSVRDSGPEVIGAAWVGSGVQFGAAVSLQDTVVGDFAQVAAHAQLQDCVVWSEAVVPSGNWRRCIFYGREVLEVDTLPQEGAQP